MQTPLYLEQQLPRKVLELRMAAVEQLLCHVAVQDPYRDLECPGL